VTREETFENIARNELKFPEHPRCVVSRVWSLSCKIDAYRGIEVSRDCKNLIKKLLHPDPKKRLGSEGGAAEVKSMYYSLNND